jgi:DNA-binding CsgD family transcriptional regulator
VALAAERLDAKPEHRGDENGHDPAVLLRNALFRGRALIDSTISLQSRRPAHPAPVAHTGRSDLVRAMEEALGQGRQCVGIALAESCWFTEVALDLLDRVPPGPFVRVLCTAAAADAHAQRLGRFEELRPRSEVRVTDRELRAAAVVDGTTAVVAGPSAAQTDGQTAAVIADIGTAQALELLFAAAWSGCRKLSDHLRFGPRLRSELGRSVLRELCSGTTDEAAARELAVSLRTYRRYVADIMRELDAGSRFQVGVRAFESGLLS